MQWCMVTQSSGCSHLWMFCQLELGKTNNDDWVHYLPNLIQTKGTFISEV